VIVVIWQGRPTALGSPVPALARRGRAGDPASDPVSEGDEAMIRQSCALVSHAASAVVGTIVSPWPHSAWRAHASYVSSMRYSLVTNWCARSREVTPVPRGMQANGPRSFARERDIDRQPLRGKRDYNFAVRLKAVRQFGIRRT
jgi:hypothetical protein